MSRRLHATRTHGQRLLPNKFALTLVAAFAQGSALLSAALPGIAGFAIAATLPTVAHAVTTVTTIAGGGSPGGIASGHADGTGTAATFNGPYDMAIDGNGDMYVVDLYNNLIRKVTPAGVVTTFAGGGSPGGIASGHADGTGTAATFSGPVRIAIDSSGNLYTADYYTHLIRKITPAGVVTTLAGGGSPGGIASGHADGTGTAATFNRPTGIAIDSSGNLYVADGFNNLIRKITPAGVVTTFAGGGSPGGTTAGLADGTGTAATFDHPYGITIDGSGNLYVADTYNSLIRKITPAGVVTTLAGGGSPGGKAQGHADGTGSSATFKAAEGISIDGNGNLYVADTGNNLVRKITPAGVVTTIAAAFNGLMGIIVDGNGNLYVADTNNNLVRKITFSPSLSSSLPADNATDVLPGSTIALTFSAAMTLDTTSAAGTRLIRIVNDTDNTTETIDIASPANGQLVFSNNNKTLTITPATALASGKSYHLEIGSTALKDAASTAYPGIATNDLTTLNFTIASVPDAPTIGTATAGDGRISVSFTAPASSGSSAITGYTATCSDGTHSFTGTGSSSPIAVSGLTNGTAYTCTVTATSSIGTSPASAATASATPAAPATPATPVTPSNPFNPGGTSTSTEVNNNVGNNLGGGVTVTPATGSIISNLSEVSHTTGVSDNGVVVVNAPPGKTIKLVDNAPNGVLFSLPVQQAIPVQLQGRTVAITVNNEVVKDASGKPLTAVLATRTVTEADGKPQQVLEVISGQGQFQASTPNQLLGSLTLSQGGTLRTVTIVDNAGNGGGTAVPGTAGIFKNPKDKSGSVSAENGAVVLNVLLTPEGATASNRLATEATKQITLQAGEVARFNAKGELIGVFAGSLSGTLGKTGDPVAVTTPVGLAAYPAKAVKLDGNTLDRLGSNLLTSFASVIGGTGNFADDSHAAATDLSQDVATRIVTARNAGRPDLTFTGLPIGSVTVDPATPDGIVWHTNGSVTWSLKGVSVTFVPVSGALTELAGSAAQLGYSAQVLDNGVVKLTGNASYLVGLPRFAAIKEGKAAGFAWEAKEARATFTDSQGYTQIIDPVPYDGSQLDTTVAGMPGWKMSREYFLYGTLRLTGPGGEQFLLTPDYAVTLGKGSSLNGSAYTGDDGRLHYRFTTGFLPFSQGFAVR